MIEFLTPYFAFVSDPTAWVALLTLIVLEIVLGIDTHLISILTNCLRQRQCAPLATGGAGDARPACASSKSSADPSPFFLFGWTSRGGN